MAGASLSIHALLNTVVYMYTSCLKTSTVILQHLGIASRFQCLHWSLLLGWTVDTQRCLYLMCVLKLKGHSADHFIVFFFFLPGWWECEYHLLSEPMSLGQVVPWPQNTLLWRGAISFLCTDTEWCQGLPPCRLLF